MTQALPTDSAERKGVPLARGLLDYFPAALAEVAKLSQAGNDKHNPGEELHHARGKSMDHADCIMRHLVDRGIVDDDGFLHEVKVAWRALALLQEELERRGAPVARGAKLAGTVVASIHSVNGVPVPEVIERPWIKAPDHEPLLSSKTRIRVRLRDGFEANTTVGGTAWGPCFGQASVAEYKLLD